MSAQVIITSKLYLLQSRAFQEQLDIVANSVSNLATSASPRATVLTDLVAMVNDLRAMDTSVWAFVNPAAAQTFPTYAEADKISRGPYASNSNSAQAALMITNYLLPIVQNIQTVMTAMTDTPDIISYELGTQFQVYPIQGAWTTAYNDFIAKIAVVITDLPLLTT